MLKLQFIKLKKTLNKYFRSLINIIFFLNVQFLLVIFVFTVIQIVFNLNNQSRNFFNELMIF